MLWYRKHSADLFGRTRKIVSAATYLVFRLTGRFVVDNYVAPYFTPFFDVNRLAWQREWVEQVCPLEWLPETAWSVEQAGRVTARASEETGIPAGTPVAVGTADALAGSGRCRRHDQWRLMVMYGTTLFLIQTTAEYRAHRDLWASVHLMPGAAILAAGMSTSGALLAWFRDRAGREERAEAEKSGDNAFALLAARATETRPGGRIDHAALLQWRADADQ